MKQTKSIEILVYPDGTIEAETFGMKGEECMDKLEELLSGLLDVDDAILKPEYYDDSNVEINRDDDNIVNIDGD
jgi:hypothetical protein